MGRLSARAISYLLLTYVLVSCLYVLFILLAFPLARAVLSRQPAISVHSIPENWRNDQIFWRYNTDSILTSSTGRQYAISESLFLGKAFDHSMRPSKVVPFYFKAVGTKSNGEFQREDITILTIVTSNRFSVLAKLVKRYQGPISVALHVRSTPQMHRDQILDELHALYISTPGMSTYVDVHLITDEFDRQFNMWRNAARLFARTDFVMMLDVDFAICTDFRSKILSSPDTLRLLRSGEAAFVIPAFEYVNETEGRDESTFPKTKQELAALYEQGRIHVFHQAWEGGHNSSDYARYFNSSPGDVYKVLSYQYAYEPYVIFKRDAAPWCDERFIGYGGNKASCLYEMYLAGISFYVLSDDFLAHQSHAYAEDIRKAERRYNKQLYIEFRTEACLRALHRSIVLNELTTPRGLNVQGECQKIRGASALAIEMISQLA